MAKRNIQDIPAFTGKERDKDGLSVVLGFIVTLVILAPYYIWRRKNYKELIVKHEYIVDAPRFSRMQKVVVLCGTIIYGITPLIALVVFAPLTSR